MDNKVTIVVPVYNMELYLRRCLDSLICQTYNNIEILIVNDGSTDTSKLIMEEYANNDSRIHIINKSNGGYGSVLSYALKNMNTEYFIICDADDCLEKNAIEVLVNNSYDNDIVYAKYYNVNGNEKNEMIYSTFFELINKRCYKEDLDRFVFIPVSPHAKLYKRELFKDIIIPEKIYFTDALLYYYALSKAKSLIYVDNYLADYYFNREGNTQTDENPIIFDYHEKIVEHIVSQCELDKHKYFSLGLLFYNMYTLIKLSKYEDSIINNKKEYLYSMFENLMPYGYQIDNIKEAKQSLIELKNLLLSELKYKETIDNMLSEKNNTEKVFIKELSNLSK